jgi:putative glutathione S-transferase
MGLLIEGQWHDRWYDTRTTGGRFERAEARFRSWVTPDGSPGPTGHGGFAAEPGRYRLYVSLACPWAHRTLIVRKLKGLESMVPLSVTHWRMLEHGWTFDDGPGVIPDTVNGARYLHQIYTLADPAHSGRATVPVLWDTRTDTIVSNESSEIVRMFNTAFDALGAAPGDYYPSALRETIDTLNARIYATVNDGVYRAGFATEQRAYEKACAELFESLDWLDAHLSSRRYLAGATLTEADIRLLTTLLRFDTVYYGHFKTNRKHLYEYPALWAYTRDLYQSPGIRETVDFDHIKRHYYESQRAINPSGVVPLGPEIDFDAPHGRRRMSDPGSTPRDEPRLGTAGAT